MKENEIIVRVIQDKDEITQLLRCILKQLDENKKLGEQFMSTTNDALSSLKAQVAKLQSDFDLEKTVEARVLAGVTRLLAGATSLPNGQVAVAQADLDALTAATVALDNQVVAETGEETTAADAVDAASPAAQNASKTGTGVNQA